MYWAMGLGAGEKPGGLAGCLLHTLLSSDWAAHNDLVFCVTHSLFILARRQEAGRIQAPTAAGRTQTREGARHRRLARRRGKAKACVATGNTQLKVYHKLLSNPGMRHQDLRPDYYERQRGVRRQVACHVGKLGALGFEVTLCRIPEPDPDKTGPAQTV